MADTDPFEAAGFVRETSSPVMSGGVGGITTLPEKPSDKITWRQMTPDEVKTGGRDPSKVYQIGSNGEVKESGSANMPEKHDLSEAIKGLGLDELLTSVSRAREKVDGGWATGILGKMGGMMPGSDRNDFLGSLEGIKGAVILDKLQALKDVSKTGASGMGSLSEQEGERMASSVAALNPNMSGDEIKKSLAIIEHHARVLKAVGAGKDPNDPAVQQEFGIGTLPDQTTPTDTVADPTAMSPSNGDTKSVIDPQKQALGAKIAILMGKGASRNTIMAFAVGADPTLRDDPRFQGWVDSALAFRAKHPGQSFSVDPDFYTSQVPLSGVQKLLNEGAATGLGGGVAAYGTNAADALTAGNLGNLTGDKEAANRALAVGAQAHPLASLGGSVSGGALAAMLGEAGLAKLGLQPGILRATMSDSLYGGANGASNAQPGNTLGGLTKGLLIGAGGSLAGQGIMRGTGKAIAGVTAPSARTVEQLGVPLTIGQAVSQSGTTGKIVKGVEDALTSLPGVGDQINARRMEGLTKMNSKAFEKALEPIKGTVSGKVGEEAVADAQDHVTNAFQKALGGKMATIDQGFISDASKAKAALGKLPAHIREEVNGEVDTVINAYVDPHTMTVKGEDMQAMLQELGAIKRSYSGGALGHRVGLAVDQVTDSVEGMFQRQAPEVMPQYNAAKQSFRRVSILEDAVNRAKNADTGGVFTPGQLGMADRANSVKFDGKSAAAAGKSQFHDFHKDAQSVLPNKVPDSGTGKRLATLAVPAALSSSGAGVGYAAGDPQDGAATGLGLGGLLALAYTKTGQRALVGMAMRGRGSIDRAVGQALVRGARPVAAIGGTQAALDSNR